MFSYPISREKDIGGTIWSISLWAKYLVFMNVRTWAQIEKLDTHMLIGDIFI